MRFRKSIVALAAMCFAMLQACDSNANSASSGDRSTEGKGTMAFRLSQANLDLLRQEASYFKLVISGSGMLPDSSFRSIDTLITANGIPCGTRIVEVSAIDSVGNSLWYGRDTVEINPNQFVWAHIVLHPNRSLTGSLGVDLTLDGSPDTMPIYRPDTTLRDTMPTYRPDTTHRDTMPIYRPDTTHRDTMPVYRPDTTHRDTMPVYRPDTTRRDTTHWLDSLRRMDTLRFDRGLDSMRRLDSLLRHPRDTSTLGKERWRNNWTCRNQIAGTSGYCLDPELQDSNLVGSWNCQAWSVHNNKVVCETPRARGYTDTACAYQLLGRPRVCILKKGSLPPKPVF